MAKIGDFEGVVSVVYLRKIANIRHLQLQRRQNTTTEKSLRLF